MLYRLYCRVYQKLLKFSITHVITIPKPILIHGSYSVQEMVDKIEELKLKKLLVVTDKTIISLGLLNIFLTSLKSHNIEVCLFDETVQNPTVENVEKALQLFLDNNCQALIGFGGGSPIDCAKAVGARAVKPEKSLFKMRGILKVNCKLPILFAVPTTSGTGSEATASTVVTDSKTHHKYAISDPVLVPSYAILDPSLSVDLPKHLTATTAMDALTHAVESYIGVINTKETIYYSEAAIKLFAENISEVYNNGENLEARNNMQRASYLAGLAFTRAYVGYVHAIAHCLWLI